MAAPPTVSAVAARTSQHAPRGRAAAEQHRGQHGDEEERDDARLGRPDVVHGRHSSRCTCGAPPVDPATAVIAVSPTIRGMIRRAGAPVGGTGRGGGVPGSVGEQRRVHERGRGRGRSPRPSSSRPRSCWPAASRPASCASEGSAGNEIVTLANWIFGILAVVLLTVWGHPRLRHHHAARAAPRRTPRRPRATCASRSSGRPSRRSSSPSCSSSPSSRPSRIDDAGPAARSSRPSAASGGGTSTSRSSASSRPTRSTWRGDAPTSIDVESADVIHSFWVPQMGGKVDMIPGHVNHIHFVPLTTGQYLGECSEFCGVQHGSMRFLFVVVPPEEYSAWVERQQQPAAEPTGADAVAGETGHQPAWAAAAATPSAARRSRAPSGRTSPTSAAAAASPPTRCATRPRTCCAGSRTRRGSSPSATCPTCPLPLQQQKQLVAYLEELK